MREPRVSCKNQILPGPMPKLRRAAAESGARCGPREHREMSSCYRAAEFFVHTDPADSRNMESQQELLQECGLVATVLPNLNISTNQYDMYRLMSFS
jgi:hypothetical protein